MDALSDAMQDLPGLRNWLLGAGYENFCFVSWAHSGKTESRACAVNLKEAIETELSNYFHFPRVFVDDQGIQGGDDWRKQLRKELCHSIVMVPIWTPIYCAPEHHWCGLEWTCSKRNVCRTNLTD
jgi:hypothetical protein